MVQVRHNPDYNEALEGLSMKAFGEYYGLVMGLGAKLGLQTAKVLQEYTLEGVENSPVGNNHEEYTDPKSKTNFVIISMFQGGGSENVGSAFADAANTRANEIKNSKTFNPTNSTVFVFNIDSIAEMRDVFSKGHIDQLDVFSHGEEQHLVVGSGDGPNKRELLYASDLNGFNANAFNKGAFINFFGCKTASEKDLNFLQNVFGKKTIADSFASYFKGTTVTGFTGGSMAVPSPDAKTDINFIHKAGNPVWYKSASGSRSYWYE